MIFLYFLLKKKENKTNQNSHILTFLSMAITLFENKSASYQSFSVVSLYSTPRDLLTRTSATLPQGQVVTGGEFCAISFWGVPQTLQYVGPRKAPSSFSYHQASQSWTYFDCTLRLSELTTAPPLPCWTTRLEVFTPFWRKNRCHSQVEDVLKATMPPKIPILWEGGLQWDTGC